MAVFFLKIIIWCNWTASIKQLFLQVRGQGRPRGAMSKDFFVGVPTLSFLGVKTGASRHNPKSDV